MKSFGLKVIVTLLAFFTGIGFVWIFKSFDYINPVQRFDENTLELSLSSGQNSESRLPVSSDGAVEIKFTKFFLSEGSLIAEFQVANRNINPASYWLYINNQGEQVGSPNPQFKINGVETKIGYCGTGMKEFQLKAGESKLFRVSGLQLAYFLGKARKNIQVGYWFTKNNEEGKLVWSEKFQIPDSVIEQLNAEKKKLER